MLAKQHKGEVGKKCFSSTEDVLGQDSHTLIDLALCYSLFLLQHLESTRIPPPLSLQGEGMFFPATPWAPLALPPISAASRQEGYWSVGETMSNAAPSGKGTTSITGLPMLATTYLALDSNSKATTNAKAAGFRQNNISASPLGACPGCCAAGGWRGREQILLPLTAPWCLTAAYCRLREISIHNEKCPLQER